MTKEIIQYLKEQNIKGTKQYKTLKASRIASFYEMVVYENHTYMNGVQEIEYVN